MSRTNDDWNDKYGSEFQRPRLAYIDDDGTKVYESDLVEPEDDGDLQITVYKDESQ